MKTTTTFSKFVSPEGRASMVWEYYAGDTVRITDRFDTVRTVMVYSLSETPDGEPLVVVSEQGKGMGHYFASDIVQVETI